MHIVTPHPYLDYGRKYVLGQRGGNCGSLEKIIRSKNECRLAADSLGLDRNAETEWSGRYPVLAYGCSIRVGWSHKNGAPADNVLHFEETIPTTTQFGDGRDDLTPICIE